MKESWKNRRKRRPGRNLLKRSDVAVILYYNISVVKKKNHFTIQTFLLVFLRRINANFFSCSMLIVFTLKRTKEKEYLK